MGKWKNPGASALSTGNETLLASVTPKLQSEICHAKHSHAKKVEQSFDTCDRGSWTKLKPMLKLKGQDKD